jgi:hypothetical protein
MRTLRNIGPFILAVVFIGLAIWWTYGVTFAPRPNDFDPRADSNSEGQCP